MSWMRNNMWVSFIPIMIIMKIEYTIPGKTSLLEFALFIKFIMFQRRQIGHIYLCDFFFIIFRRTISSRSGSHKLRNTLYMCSNHILANAQLSKLLATCRISGPFLLLYELLCLFCNKFTQTEFYRILSTFLFDGQVVSNFKGKKWALHRTYYKWGWKGEKVKQSSSMFHLKKCSFRPQLSAPG